MEQETLDFRRAGFSPALSLLMPTFAFPFPPDCLTTYPSAELECSPTDLYYKSPRFGGELDARLLSTLHHSTSELLRTL